MNYGTVFGNPFAIAVYKRTTVTLGLGSATHIMVGLVVGNMCTYHIAAIAVNSITLLKGIPGSSKDALT